MLEHKEFRQKVLRAETCLMELHTDERKQTVDAFYFSVQFWLQYKIV